MKTAHSASDTWIALDKAVKEFGPCEGGYDKARVRILREISSNPEFDFKLNGEPPKAYWAKGFEGNVREWFGELAEAASQDNPDTELLGWLNGEEGPQVNFAQTRSIWIVEKPEGWVSNSDLNPEWNESEALAWIATMDTYIVGQSQNMQELASLDDYIGLLSYISSENCPNPSHRNDHEPKWKTCGCLGSAWDQLYRLSIAGSTNGGVLSSLRYSFKTGCVKLEHSNDRVSPLFRKKHVFRLKPSTDPSSLLAQEMERLQSHQTNTGSPGRPPKGKSYYFAEFSRRLKADEWDETLSKESRYLRKWFIINHPLKALPSLKTIENAIRDKFNEAKKRRRLDLTK